MEIIRNFIEFLILLLFFLKYIYFKDLASVPFDFIRGGGGGSIYFVNVYFPHSVYFLFLRVYHQKYIYEKLIYINCA